MNTITHSLTIFLLLTANLNKEIFFTMSTYASISLPDTKLSKKIRSQLLNRLKEIEMRMDDYRPDSELAMINKMAAKKAVDLSNDTFYVIKRSLEISKQSKGAFDITVWPLLKIWGFKNKSSLKKIPKKESINKILKEIGWQKVKLTSQKLSFDSPLVKIDLGGIAKGFAVDELVKILKQNGINNALVEIGGDLYCLGAGPDNKGWKIGIQHPKNFERIIARIKVKNRAVATSGSYINFRTIEGRRFSHIIDPRTGWPVDNKVVSVTVLAPTCLEADAWATALFVLGIEDGMSYVEKQPDLEAVFIIEDKNGKLKLHISSGLKENFENAVETEL